MNLKTEVGDASTSQGMPKIAGKPPEARGEHGTNCPLQPKKEPTLLTPWPWTSGLQNCENADFCCSRHLVCSIELGYSNLSRQIQEEGT